MIILDTNVVSEPTKRRSSPTVVEWLDRQTPETLFLTSVSLAELLLGIELLPDGKRKNGLSSGLFRLMGRLFGPRILDFDSNAAAAFASAIAGARKAGRAVEIADGQIAAIALSRNFKVATRDTPPFEAMGVSVINPWIDV